MTRKKDIEPNVSWRRATVSALALAALALSPVVMAEFKTGAVLAQSTGGDHSGGKGGKGGHDDDDHADEGHDDGHDDDHEGGSGKKGGGQDDQGQGGQAQGQGGKGEGGKGQGGPSATGGGKPVWAQEGIPEVELGRLNVARSPDRVLQRAYDEALASLSPEMAGFYNMSLNEAILALSTDFYNQSYIDSPLQNLALLKDALDGTSVLNTLPQISNSNGTLMAVFLGVASDKTVPISNDTVTAVTTILGSPITGNAAAALASDAESVRIAVLAGHG